MTMTTTVPKATAAEAAAPPPPTLASIPRKTQIRRPKPKHTMLFLTTTRPQRDTKIEQAFCVPQHTKQRQQQTPVRCLQVISVEALATEFGEFAEEDVYGSDNDHDDLTSRQHSETTVSMASCLGARSETMTSTASSIGPRSETTASIGSSLNLRSETMASIASTRSPPFENAASLDSCLASRETIVSTGSFFRPPLDITASLGSPLSPRALTMPLMGSSLTERSKSLQVVRLQHDACHPKSEPTARPNTAPLRSHTTAKPHHITSHHTTPHHTTPSDTLCNAAHY